jgi:hypothetical protein
MTKPGRADQTSHRCAVASGPARETRSFVPRTASRRSFAAALEWPPHSLITAPRSRVTMLSNNVSNFFGGVLARCRQSRSMDNRSLPNGIERHVHRL